MKPHWIKWYPVSWLHSTARDEMNAAERATFHDFVCLADTSSIPGTFKFVSEESLGRMLNTEPAIISSAIKICLARKRISIKKNKEGYVLRVLKWHIYQALTPVDNKYKTHGDKVNDKDSLSSLLLSGLLSTDKDINSITIEVIEYLNLKTGKNYRSGNPKTRELIFRRIKIDKATIDEFKKVIDVKTAEWSGTENDKYLRPETLFGTKFESYRNQKAGIGKTESLADQEARMKKQEEFLRKVDEKWKT